MDDLHWLKRAISLSWHCPPSESAFSVGALIVSTEESVVATGHSRQEDPHDHAEEVALRHLASPPPGATMYSSLEPCGNRASRSRTCAELIIDAGIRRVVFAWSEPPRFVTGTGAGLLRAAGVEVLQYPELAESAKAANSHLF